MRESVRLPARSKENLVSLPAYSLPAHFIGAASEEGKFGSSVMLGGGANNQQCNVDALHRSGDHCRSGLLSSSFGCAAHRAPNRDVAVTAMKSK